MRPTVRFSLFAASACALAATGAPAQSQSPPTLRIVTETPGLPAGKGEQLEIESFHWGPRQSTSAWELEPARITSYQLGSGASAGGGANAIRMDDTAGREKLQPGGGGGAAQMDMVLKGSTIGQNSRVGANETLTVGGGRTEGLIGQAIGQMAVEGNEDSAQATGKRQHKPMTITKEWDARSAPLPQGSVRVKVKMPWIACRVGNRYPRLELTGGGKTHVLEDVRVASCGSASGDADDRPTEEVAFYYNRIL